VGTRDASRAALRWEAGAGAQTTRRGLRAVLSREAGTTPSPPLPRPSMGGQGMAPSRSGRRCLYLAATLLGLPPPPPSMTSTTTSTSATSSSKGYHLHVVLVGFLLQS
jgi:hypothetical protein